MAVIARSCAFISTWFTVGTFSYWSASSAVSCGSSSSAPPPFSVSAWWRPSGGRPSAGDFAPFSVDVVSLDDVVVVVVVIVVVAVVGVFLFFPGRKALRSKLSVV